MPYLSKTIFQLLSTDWGVENSQPAAQGAGLQGHIKGCASMHETCLSVTWDRGRT